MHLRFTKQSDAFTTLIFVPCLLLSLVCFCLFVAGTYAMSIAQKLVEKALSDDPVLLQQTSTRLSAPSVWQRMQFDP